MRFGIFDYIDRRAESIPRTYDERMVLIQAAEAAGFYGYHVTEHHATPLSATPSPAVFLAAAARETTRIRLGALLFLLPLYHPYRLLEELLMLDNLSRGRLDIGLGRGISPFEFAALGQDIKVSDRVYAERLEIVWQGLWGKRIDHHGEHYQIANAPLPMDWVQRPHPPLWYGLRNGPDGSLLPARRGMNVVTLGNDERATQAITRFLAAWPTFAVERRETGSIVDAPMIGLVRGMFIADTDAEAERLARPAYRAWFDNLMWLWKENNAFPGIPLSQNFDESIRDGSLVVGSPDTVRRKFLAQANRCGHNYLVLKLAFGCFTHAQEMHSLELFRREVMPALLEAHPESNVVAVNAA
ncbi:MAG: LLM class flavin-dependent oxidoreductase [Betaproteobacteria bacterium]|nr:LLM class flavin-dependent oxidoreductase [Betaproteobacteria bacterium]